MTELGRLSYLRPCSAADDVFLHDVFATTWENEVAALPNQNLAQHVIRIQHIAQERRLAGQHPGYDRFVVVQDGQDVGRLYVDQDDETLSILDLTLMPTSRSRGIGSRVVRDLFQEAALTHRTVSVRVSRRDREATDFCVSLGFQLASVDDLENHFQWSVDLEGAARTGSFADEHADSDSATCRHR